VRGIDTRSVVSWDEKPLEIGPAGTSQREDFGLFGRRHVVYDRLHLRKSSPLSRLQREMVAVVVNGHVNGAP
jgi:hypothetical protein